MTKIRSLGLQVTNFQLDQVLNHRQCVGYCIWEESGGIHRIKAWNEETGAPGAAVKQISQRF